MELSTILLGIGLALYGISGALFLGDLLKGLRLRASVIALVGLLVQSAGIVLRGMEQHHAPFTNLFESLVFLAWALVAVYLVMGRGQRISALGAFACLTASVALASGLLLPKEISSTLIPALGSRWSTIHVASALVSYAGFLLAFGASLAYILQERMLKTKRINALQKHLPPLDVLDRFAYRMVTFAFPMLTLGIVTGALWAQSAWGRYWNWDPKETWSLITWLVYAAYLHVRVMQGWRGKWANRLLVAGFACIIITYLGVNLLSAGLHRYNW